MATIQQFKSAFKGGVRPNLFRMNLTTGAGVAMTDLEFLVKSTQLPGSQVEKVEVPYQGRMLAVPGDRTFEDWTVTMWNDPNWANRGALEAWMGRISAHSGNYTQFNRDQQEQQYGIARVSQLDRQGKTIRTYQMDVLPTALAAIDVSNETQNEVQEFEVTFAVNWFTIDGAGFDATQNGSGIDISGTVRIGPVQVNF